ncbi:MAG: GTPase [Candidatus Eisenbacteria bacterium]
MPANLTPQYREAERKFREAKTPSEKLSFLREMLAVIPKHKGTEKMQADLKKRISKLQDSVAKSHRVGRRPYAFSVEREGAGQIVLVGPANSGKSSFLRSLTHAEPEVAPYPFTTRTPLPGMMQFEDVQIQLVDMPPIQKGDMEHWFYQLLRNADGALVVLDATAPALLEELELAGGHLAQGKAGRVLVLANKMDLKPDAEAIRLLEEAAGEMRDSAGNSVRVVPCSALTGAGSGEIRREVFQLLGLVRVYTKIPGKKPDTDRPFVVKTGSTVLDVAGLVHKDFAVTLKFAKIWGSGTFEGQCVQRDHAVKDRDVVEFHI